MKLSLMEFKALANAESPGSFAGLVRGHWVLMVLLCAGLCLWLIDTCTWFLDANAELLTRNLAVVDRIGVK